MTKIITAVFNDVEDATRAVDRVVALGVPTDDLSVLTSETTSENAFAVRTGSKVGEGAAIGAGTGGAIGAMAAGLTSVGALATGGAGLVAVGPIIAAFAGAGAGATAGGVVGGLVGAGIPEHEAKFYEDAIEKGGVLVGVQAEGDRRDAIEDIFEDCNAEKVSRA